MKVSLRTSKAPGIQHYDPPPPLAPLDRAASLKPSSGKCCPWKAPPSYRTYFKVSIDDLEPSTDLPRGNMVDANRDGFAKNDRPAKGFGSLDNFSPVIRRTGDVSFPGMLIKRILCGEDAILNNVDQSEALLGRLGGVAGVDEGEDTCAPHYH